MLYPTPISESFELVGPTPFKATLTEAPIPGDASSARVKDELPAYVAYQSDGDVTAPLVYVNYGMVTSPTISTVWAMCGTSFALFFAASPPAIS